MKHQTITKLVTWSIQLLIFAVLPVALLYSALNYLEETHYSDQLETIEQDIVNEFRELELIYDTEQFFASSLLKAYTKMANANGENSGNPFKELYNQTEEAFDYIIWKPDGEIEEATFDFDELAKAVDLKQAALTITDAFAKNRKNHQFSPYEIENIKKLFGPQTSALTFYNCLNRNNKKLLWTAASKTKPLAWIAWHERFIIAALVNHEQLQTPLGLKHYIRHSQPKQSPHRFGYIDGGQIIAPDYLPEADVLPQLAQYEVSSAMKVETESAVYYPRRIAQNLTIFGFVDKAALANLLPLSPAMAAALFTLLLLPYICLSFAMIVLQKPLRMSISVKIGLLFAFANGLPIAVLMFIGYDYLQQKQFTLLDDIHSQATRLLQNFDERFDSEYARQIVKLRQATDWFKPELAQGLPNKHNYTKLLELMHDSEVDQSHDPKIFLIASETELLGTKDLLIIDDKTYSPRNPYSKSSRRSSRDKEESKLFMALGRFVLAAINGQPPDSKTATELELLVESALQKSLLELQHEFITGRGKIQRWGMGEYVSRFYIDMLKTDDSSLFSYLLLKIWSPSSLEEGYITRQFLNAARNISDLKIFILNEEFNVFYPEELRKRSNIRGYAKSIGQRPLPARQFVEFDGQHYMAMGFKGKFLADFTLLALYPAELVDQQIDKERRSLIVISLFSLMLAIALGQLLSHSFIYPLGILSEGAKAITERIFSSRLPKLGRDEFGQMAVVFNETMVDLEELQVAGVVQTYLFPQKLPQTGRFKIYGRSIAPGNLGGDFYDYFDTSEGRFSTLIGDVCSDSGLASSLIMAMAKGAILQFENHLESPAKLMMKMDSFIKETSQKDQSKFMALQYINIDAATGQAIFTNAGGWYPLLVTPDLPAPKELNLVGPLLGSLNQPTFSEMQINFVSKQSLLLFTNGILDSHNNAGEAFGYSRLKELAVSCYDSDPEVYFNKIYASYARFMAGNTNNEDLCLLILTFE